VSGKNFGRWVLVEANGTNPSPAQRSVLKVDEPL